MNRHQASVAESLPETDIAEYLRRHPDFFERHDKLLLGLRLPHSRNGATVSLVERQVAMLRQRNGRLEQRLKGLVEIAKFNDALVAKIHRLSLRLLAARSTAGVFELVETTLREQFAADRAALVVYEDTFAAASADGRFALAFRRDDPALKPFATFLEAARTRCGRLRERQKSLLFGSDDEAQGSAAMVPLGAAARYGFLVIYNSSVDHFNPGKSTDFLDQLGELIAAALEQHAAPAIET